MKSIKEIVKLFIDKKVLIITLTIWLLMNFTGYENIYFIESSLKRIVTMKVLHFFFLYVLIFILKYIYNHRKEARTKHGIIIFGIYFLIMFIILLLIWPGAWTTDDIIVINRALNYGLYPWQHLFTSLIYIMFLKTLPFATGVLIMQIIIDGMMVGYCISTVGDLFIKDKRHKIIWECLLLIPMIFPPVIFQVLSGWRMSIYMFIELLLIVRFIEIYRNKKDISLISLIILSILVIIISSWRSEGIYYLLCYIFILLVFFKKYISKKSAIISFIVCVLMTLGIGKVNNYLIGDDEYLLTAVVEPVYRLVLKADKEKDKEDLEKINKILDINMIYENPHVTASSLFWKGLVRKDYSKEDYKNFFVTYLKLTLKYPATTFSTMGNIFLNAAGINIDNNGKSMQNNVVLRTPLLFDIHSEYGNSWQTVKSKLKSPINESIREKAIYTLGCVDKEGKVNSLYFVFWNLLIPILLALICLIYYLIKKNWFTSFILAIVLVRILVVFITAPLGSLGYYISVYIICYFLSILTLCQLVSKYLESKA